MIVQLHQISESKSQFEFTLTGKNLTKLEERFSFKLINCKAILKESADHVYLQGQFSTNLETPCDFCLAPAELNLDKEFEIKLVADQKLTSEPTGDLKIPLHGMDTESFDGHEINLATIFEDQLLLELPLSIKCKESCKGVCSSCGMNLNQGSCSCKTDNKDNPFAVLSQLKL